jgi:cytidylate kinase
MYSIDIPKKIGIKLNGFNLDQSPDRIKLPDKTIIRIFGTICSGKGTISKSLSDYYKIPHIDTGKIWRAVTYICSTNNLEPSFENVINAFDQLSVKIVEGSFYLIYNEAELENHQLKNPAIDSIIFKYSVYREAYNKFLVKIFEENEFSMVLDGRGSMTPYLIQAEKLGYRVIRIFLCASLDESAKRRMIDYKNNGNAELDIDQIKELIYKRDKADYETLVSQNLGFITPDTAILDTSDIEINEAFEICKNYINNLTSTFDK